MISSLHMIHKRAVCIYMCLLEFYMHKQLQGNSRDKMPMTAEMHSSAAASSDDQRKWVRTHAHTGTHTRILLHFWHLKSKEFIFGTKETSLISRAVLYMFPGLAELVGWPTTRHKFLRHLQTDFHKVSLVVAGYMALYISSQVIGLFCSTKAGWVLLHWVYVLIKPSSRYCPEVQTAVWSV